VIYWQYKVIYYCNVISEHVHVYVNVYVKYILQRMIQIKNMNSFGSFLYFVFFKRVLYCWSIILMSKQYNTFYEEKTNKNNHSHPSFVSFFAIYI
jgi:hypothetical protein